MSACSTVEMSSSGRNDFRMNANAPDRSAPIAASIVAKPVMSTTSPNGEAARSGRMRSTPLASGSFTSTMATSNPCARAIARPSSPRDAVTTSIVLDAARPSESSALMSTACSVPTSSTLSSTMRTRPRRRHRLQARDRGHVATLPDPEQLLQHLVHELRIRAPLRLLHHLPDEEAEQAGLAGAELRRPASGSLDEPRARSPRSRPRR